MHKTQARRFALLGATFLGLLLGGCEREPSEAEKARRTEQALIEGFTRMAEEYNAKGPTMMDEHTRLDSTEVGPGARISYFYTLPQYASTDFSGSQFLDQVGPVIRAGTCSDQNILRTLNEGAIYSFIYRGKDGIEIARLDLNRDACPHP